MPDKWDKSSKNDFNNAAARPSLKDNFNDKAKSGEATSKPKEKQDQPKLELKPPGMSSTSNRTAWDRSRPQNAEPSKQGPTASKEDPRLSKNFNNRAKN